MALQTFSPNMRRHLPVWSQPWEAHLTQGHSSTAGVVSGSSLSKSRPSKLLAPDVDEAPPPWAFSHLLAAPLAGSGFCTNGDSLKDELLGNDLGDSECSPRLSTVPVAGCGFCTNGDSLKDELLGDAARDVDDLGDDGGGLTHDASEGGADGGLGATHAFGRFGLAPSYLASRPAWACRGGERLPCSWWPPPAPS